MHAIFERGDRIFCREGPSVAVAGMSQFSGKPEKFACRQEKCVHDGRNRDSSLRIAYYVSRSRVPASVRAERFVKRRRPKSQLGCSGSKSSLLA
uniref:Uncharacterized protein n=1 Tax=Rhipicephalus zambeziensis TaxID=60191 RepID=A0A224YJF6_9ACAR